MNDNEERRKGVVARFFGSTWSSIRNFGSWYKGLYKGKRWYIKTVVAMVTFVVLLVLYLGAVDINFLWLFGK